MNIRSFRAADQQAVRPLILAGLGEHFGWIDAARNPDIEDITSRYLAARQTFLVAEGAGQIVGTGALITETEQVGRLVRMSVASSHRRQGIGRKLVKALLEQAKARGLRRVVLETNQNWEDAIGLYWQCGFREIDRTDGLVHMALDL